MAAALEWAEPHHLQGRRIRVGLLVIKPTGGRDAAFVAVERLVDGPVVELRQVATHANGRAVRETSDHGDHSGVCHLEGEIAIALRVVFGGETLTLGVASLDARRVALHIRCRHGVRTAVGVTMRGDETLRADGFQK